MQENEIFKALTEYLQRTGKSFEPDTDLFESDVLDSMGVLELVAFVEEELGILLDQDDLTINNFRSLNQIVITLAGKR